MNIKDLLKVQSLTNAKLIAGKDGILNEINGVNVLEALDIENWGRCGEVILTSFFALYNLTDNEMDLFFEKLHAIGISALIIKMERLVYNIPNKIIYLCNQHLIPLIQIGKDVKYETLILEILGPIINRNVYLLNKYYEVHSELTKIALKMPSMDEILCEFKKMILCDVSLINSVNGTKISTNPQLYNVTVINKNEILNERYMHFNYERSEVMYNDINTVGNQIKVHIPSVGFDDHELIIHELQYHINSEDFMVIENAVKFLQMELLKKYVVSQNLFQQKNNLTGDLLNGRLYQQKDIDEVLESLNISKYKYYQIILIQLYEPKESKDLDKNLMLPILKQIRNKFKLTFSNMAFLEKSDRIVFIMNFNKDGFNLDCISKIMNSLVKANVLKNFYYGVSISSKAEKSQIPKANKEVLDTQKVLRSFHHYNKILPYEDLGIYKLFLESNNLVEIETFISPKINAFRRDYQQLYETLIVFLNTNQNYNLTSEILFMHPKTVRYRIDKIKNILDTDFTDPEEILQFQISSRLIKLTE